MVIRKGYASCITSIELIGVALVTKWVAKGG